MPQTYHISHNDFEQLKKVATEVIAIADTRKKIALYGEIGAGKTTFSKAFCQALGTADTVSSPTYSIVNEYLTADDQLIRHIDLYRLKNLEEALDINIEEYLDDEQYCLIEWPNLIEHLLPEDIVTLHLTTQEDEGRVLTVS